jgi:hypothetical protein
VTRHGALQIRRSSATFERDGYVGSPIRIPPVVALYESHSRATIWETAATGFARQNGRDEPPNRGDGAAFEFTEVHRTYAVFRLAEEPLEASDSAQASSTSTVARARPGHHAPVGRFRGELRSCPLSTSYGGASPVSA